MSGESEENLTFSNESILLNQEDEKCLMPSDESLKMMDINDIIGVQSVVSEPPSTLDSEIDALSKVITDAKDVVDSRAADFKIDSADTSISQELQDLEAELSLTTDFRNGKDLNPSSISESEPISSNKDNVVSNCLNKSLLSIGEAYPSDDSLESDTVENKQTSQTVEKTEKEIANESKFYDVKLSSEHCKDTTSNINLSEEFKVERDIESELLSVDVEEINKEVSESECVEHKIINEANEKVFSDEEKQSYSPSVYFENDKVSNDQLMKQTEGTLIESKNLAITNVDVKAIVLNTDFTKSSFETSEGNSTNKVDIKELVETENKEFLQKLLKKDPIDIDEEINISGDIEIKTTKNFDELGLDVQKTEFNLTKEIESSKTNNKTKSDKITIDIVGKLEEPGGELKELIQRDDGQDICNDKDLFENQQCGNVFKEAAIQNQKEDFRNINDDIEEKLVENSVECREFEEHLVGENEKCTTQKDLEQTFDEDSGLKESQQESNNEISKQQNFEEFKDHKNNHTLKMENPFVETENLGNETIQANTINKIECEKMLHCVTKISNIENIVILEEDSMNKTTEDLGKNKTLKDNKEVIKKEESHGTVYNDNKIEDEQMPNIEAVKEIEEYKENNQKSDRTHMEVEDILESSVDKKVFLEDSIYQIKEKTEVASHGELESEVQNSEIPEIDNDQIPQLVDPLKTNYMLHDKFGNQVGSFSENEKLEQEKNAADTELEGEEKTKVKILPQQVLLPMKDLEIPEIAKEFPKTSILEERLKIPPKMESSNLLIPVKEVKAIHMPSKTLTKDNEHSKVETQQKKENLEKVDSEGNIGSPRIILKIAKSAITDHLGSVSEPRSPKSPKICSNSPNPEDGSITSSQKLAKIKLKLSKSGHPSIIPNENTSEEQWHKDPTLSPLGMKIKLSKCGEPQVILEKYEDFQEKIQKFDEKKGELGMKIKLSKSGDASIIQQDKDARHEEKIGEGHIGMKFKISKSGDTSVIAPTNDPVKETAEKSQRTDSPVGMKIKFSKMGGDVSIIHPNSEQNHEGNLSPLVSTEIQDQAKSMENIGVKIKIPRKGDPEIIHSKEHFLKSLKRNHSEITIEPVQTIIELDVKRRELTGIQLDSKKPKIEEFLSQRPHLMIESKSGMISQQQMNVINQEISITQVHNQDIQQHESVKADCKIGTEPEGEIIYINENSNSSQDIMIIEEVPQPVIKIPKKRGRPKKILVPDSNVPQHNISQTATTTSLNNAENSIETSESDDKNESARPKRTCRSQKSYAPPKRGRGGRGRGKRKVLCTDANTLKRKIIDQDLNEIEKSTTGRFSVEALPTPVIPLIKTPSDSVKFLNTYTQATVTSTTHPSKTYNEFSLPLREPERKDTIQEERASSGDQKQGFAGINVMSMVEKSDSASAEIKEVLKLDNKENLSQVPVQNWIAPAIKKVSTVISEPVKSTELSSVALTVMDEETRMSADSNSRSHTPARNIVAPIVPENFINEESQGSVLSTATTESEKVKVRNRRMEINFDPDEGPFTVEKIAEYEWPLPKKDEKFGNIIRGDTFMIQEQISHYLGVKSFKRKYPDLKRRMVDMEERNYLRENGLVSEAMCDMGLTAVSSSEVLDIMCSDFPEQYEEYRKYMREKQAKEHSKKQKELSQAANAERNRMDLAEMAVQSALNWNLNLNKTRKDLRQFSLDLQTFTVHIPKKQKQKLKENNFTNHYPVALIPGQYTDYYREYTPTELGYYPINTVRYGPMKPNAIKMDSQSEGSQSDSDSDSSSDGSSSSSSEITQNTEESQSTMDDVDVELVDQQNLTCKMCLKNSNKTGLTEIMIQCGTCNGNVHPSCIDVTPDMLPYIRGYAWQCTDCKTCAQCHDPADEDKMLFCDMCDRGYHIYCVGLRRVPQGRWHCQECAVCANCGSKDPAGHNFDRNAGVAAQWQHEYKKGDKNSRVYVSTLCVPCSNLRGNQGHDH